MPDPIPLIAVDGGGSGSRLRAIAPDGTAMATVQAGPSNLTFGVAPAWRNLQEGVQALERLTGRPAQGTQLWCGLAGGRSPDRQAEFRATDPLGCRRIVIVTDGFASLIGALGGACGTVLAVGTGVAAFAQHPDGSVVSSSGWGYKIGDEGGGGWIGRRAVRALSYHLDGRRPTDSALLRDLTGIVGSDYDRVQAWLALADATRFATLAPMVLDQAAHGDAVAVGIARDAAKELDLAIRAVDAEGPLALLGGLSQPMGARLAPDLRARLTPPLGTALDGLQRLARHDWHTEDHVPPGGLRDD